jgi:hypothetical protein|nr:MAG TPA: Pectate lyase [Caudoviricetes sp.]
MKNPNRLRLERNDKMKLNFNFSGKTLLKDWWKTVRDNFTTIQTDHNTLSDKLDTEITQRTNADVGLSDQITAEKKARESTDNTLQGNIDAEAKNRRVGDSELREQILTEQTNRTNADDILNGEKADKTDLYGKETDVVHTITHSLEKSDLSIDINTSYGDGTITINSLAVQTKIFLDGNSAIQTEPISASFSAEKGEEGEKWVNLLYDQYTGKLGLEVTEQPEAGNVAKIAVTYMKAEVAEMYAGQLKFDGIKDLRALKTDNKNSFLAAVNEIATKLTTEISDREDVEYSLTEKIITEISDRQAADNELKAKISDINTELTTDNLFYDLSKYVNSDNTLVTDDSGVQYLSYSGSFENGTYLYHNFVVDNFHRKPKTETTLELTFNVASRHIAGDGCNIGGLNIGETDVLITYTDTTTETFGQSYYTATDTGDKTITINGTSETYKTTKFKIEIPVKKEIKSISFRIVSDNFYTNGDPTGNACKQKTLIQSAVCYDDECVAVLRDDINANTSKITANTTKLTTEISDRQAADDELKAKFTDLKTVAFTGSYTDLSNKPTSMQNPNSLTLTMNGSATSYNGSATASKSWYAPTSAGTTGYNLISNGSGAPIWQQPPYAVCPDSPSISDRRLSITNFKLLTGVRVLVRFTYPFAGTQGKVTLNVNSTGAKEVKLLRADGSYDAITQYNSWSTNEIVEFVYDGTYWVALSSDKQFVSGKPSVITVGSSTVTRYCDFKCSGTDDDIVIQKAMDSLTDGGKIILLEGTYNLSSRLLQKKNVVIEGQGRGITKVNTSYIFLISNLVGTSPTLHLTNMDINFLSTSNISPNAGAFNDYDVLQIDNCSISYANTMHNTDSIFFNCKVKLKNSRISVTLPAKRYDNSHPCWWIFRDCTAEIIDTDIIFPTTSNNTLSNGVFYRCEGSMVGGFIKHIGTTVSSNHSYIEDDSTMNIIGTQIECRRFSQSETTTGNFNSLANCRIKILQAEGYFSASHINHCDLYISASVIFCAYCMASNCKLWFSAASLATLKNYCFFEACYTNQSTWIGTNGTGTSTTDTKTVSGMAAPSFRSVS